MAQTRTVVLDNTWVQLVTEVDFLIQNVGFPLVELFYGDTSAPTAEDKGFIVGQKEVLSSQLLSGVVYGRSPSVTEVATVSVSE